jgi:hypothetical protein
MTFLSFSERESHPLVQVLVGGTRHLGQCGCKVELSARTLRRAHFVLVKLYWMLVN